MRLSRHSIGTEVTVSLPVLLLAVILTLAISIGPERTIVLLQHWYRLVHVITEEPRQPPPADRTTHVDVPQLPAQKDPHSASEGSGSGETGKPLSESKPTKTYRADSEKLHGKPLPLRKAPNPESDQILAIPPTAEGITLTGRRESYRRVRLFRPPRGEPWCEVNFQNKKGWVNCYYLEESPSGAPSVAER